MRRRTSLRRLLQVAFTRWNVEHVFRVAKSEVGLMHFEGQSYVSLKRHLALCLVALAFVALHTMQLRGGKSGGHIGASLPGAEASLPEIPRRATANG
jgi:SRSO17 transposase